MHLLVLSAFRPAKARCTAGTWLVSMHLLVLSAFRRRPSGTSNAGARSQCTFWCSVLSDEPGRTDGRCWYMSQCTFWCSVLSDVRSDPSPAAIRMSQCTFWCSVLSDGYGLEALDEALRLNAPFGAQCFPTFYLPAEGLPSGVSMHLLVLSAFRPNPQLETEESTFYGSQCTFWCSVLSDVPSI